jgi:hypothetical protein
MVLRAVAVVVLMLAVHGESGAQRVRIHGETLLPDSSGPARGAIVVVTNEHGATQARALTGDGGQFDVAIAGPGRYELRVLRIGFRPTIGPTFDLAGGEIRAVRIVLSGEAIPLAAVTVRGDNPCRVRPDSGQLVTRLWEQAQNALTAAQLTDESGALDLHMVRYEGGSGPLRGGHVITPESVEELVAGRAFSTTAPDSLARFGYVRRQSDATLTYDAPDAAALLSEQFASLHCVHVAPAPAEHPGWIGIAFEPARERYLITDVKGTLWLDRQTAELIRLDFEYTNLPYSERDRNAGGFVEFMRLATGHWVDNRWQIRMPEHRKLIVSGRISLAGPHDFRTAGGGIARVTRDGAELFRDDSAFGIVATAAAVRAGPHAANLAGAVTDSGGRPIARAVIEAGSPSRVAIADDSGRFTIRSLPPGAINARVSRHGYEAVGFELKLAPDSTTHVMTRLAPVARAAVPH